MHVIKNINVEVIIYLSPALSKERGTGDCGMWDVDFYSMAQRTMGLIDFCFGRILILHRYLAV